MASTQRTCFECVNLAITGEGASFCTTFREAILSEAQAAADCLAYETQPMRSVMGQLP